MWHLNLIQTFITLCERGAQLTMDKTLSNIWRPLDFLQILTTLYRRGGLLILVIQSDVPWSAAVVESLEVLYRLEVKLNWLLVLNSWKGGFFYQYLTKGVWIRLVRISHTFFFILIISGRKGSLKNAVNPS